MCRLRFCLATLCCLKGRQEREALFGDTGLVGLYLMHRIEQTMALRFPASRLRAPRSAPLTVWQLSHLI